MWLTLPSDLLVDIFRRLESTAIIRCAATCRPWRRAIIDYASCLRPRPDRFLPDLLIGFLDRAWSLPRRRDIPVGLQYFPAPNTKAHAVFTPAGGGGGGGDGGISVTVDGRQYRRLLLSRDGFLLLRGDTDGDMCLFNPLTGICRAIPAAAIDDSCMYVLATGYDVDGGGNQAAVWILAVKQEGDAKYGITYQAFSSASGAWGPIRRSAKFPEDVSLAFMYTAQRHTVVLGGAVYWLVHLFPMGPSRRQRLCTFAMDLRTERTWTTELPPDVGGAVHDLILATSEDGQLSLVRTPSSSHQMDVWVLDGGSAGSRWTLRRTVDLRNLLPNCPSMRDMLLCGFCPRSGCLLGIGTDDRGIWQQFLIGVDGGLPRLIGGREESSNASIRLPYEMDWSTYISKMKYF